MGNRSRHAAFTVCFGGGQRELSSEGSAAPATVTDLFVTGLSLKPLCSEMRNTLL